MDVSRFLDLGLALVLVALNGWFVLAEFALVKVRPTRLRSLVEGGSVRAKMALRINEHLDRYLSAIQLGITLASLALGWLGEPALAHLIEPLVRGLPGASAISHGVAVSIAFFLITFLHVVLGEMAPKTMAIQRADGFALTVAWPLHLFFLLTYPVIRLLEGTSNLIVRVVGFQPASEASQAHTEDELRMIVATSAREGVLDAGFRQLLENAFDYHGRVAHEVMTPRQDAVCLDTSMSSEQAVTFALEHEFTRYPLIDRPNDRVVGFIHLRDLTAILAGERRIDSLVDIARQPVFVPEAAPIDKVRQELQGRRTHFGVVVDEYGQFTGIVTLEDLLEEIVGEIQDELDAERPTIIRNPDGSFDVDGRLLLETAARRLGLEVASGDEPVDTLGGYVFSRLGRAPAPGDAVRVGHHRLEVLRVDAMMIRRVRVTGTGQDGGRPRAS